MEQNSKVLHVIEVILASVIFLIILEYGLDMKKPYPKWVIVPFDEPITRFLSCIVIYIISCWSPILCVLLATIFIFLHLDHINLAKKNLGRSPIYFSLGIK